MKSNIRKLRIEKRITQAELAGIIGRTQQAVSQMERNRDRISIESLIALADYFNVSTDYILGLSDDAEPAVKSGQPDLESEWLKKETENLIGIAGSDDNNRLYELILSLLLCSLSRK